MPCVRFRLIEEFYFQRSSTYIAQQPSTGRHFIWLCCYGTWYVSHAPKRITIKGLQRTSPRSRDIAKNASTLWNTLLEGKQQRSSVTCITTNAYLIHQSLQTDTQGRTNFQHRSTKSSYLGYKHVPNLCWSLIPLANKQALVMVQQWPFSSADKAVTPVAEIQDPPKALQALLPLY